MQRSCLVQLTGCRPLLRSGPLNEADAPADGTVKTADYRTPFACRGVRAVLKPYASMHRWRPLAPGRPPIGPAALRFQGRAGVQLSSYPEFRLRKRFWA
jgi:hypothetical protein